MNNLLDGDEILSNYGRWAVNKAKDYTCLGHPAVARAAARTMAWGNSSHIFDLDFDLARARDLARALNLGLDHIRALGDRPLDLDLAGACNLRTHDLTSDLDFELACNLDRDLDRGLDLARDRELDFDLVFIYAHVFARRSYTGPHYPDIEHYYESVSKLIAALIQSSQRMGLSELAQALHGLRLPANEASNAAWRQFADELQALMIRYRNIGQAWNFTHSQCWRLRQYEGATIFLVECLQLAAVSDRKAIENRLLLPPED